MAILSDYTDGTVTVAANGTTVTGVGTAWQAAEFREGDWFLDGGGNAAIVASVNSNTSLTLTAPWKGPAITGGSYRLRYMSDGSRVSGQARQLINLLGGSGNLTALGGLVGAADKLPYFTGPGTMDLLNVSDILGVSYQVPQYLSPSQRGQARANIGADSLAGFRNKIINGCGEVAQRTPGVVASGAFLCDHWQHLRDGAGATVSWQTVPFGAYAEQLPGNPKTYLSVTQSVAPAGGVYNVLRLPMEGVSTLAGRKATVTLYARFPTGPGDTILRFSLRQNFGTGGAPSPAVDTYFGEAGIQPGTQFSKIQFVVDLPSISTKTIGNNGNDSLDLFIYLPVTQTFVFDITKVSVVEGDATAEDDPFSPRHIQQEMALCQRYYCQMRFSMVIPAVGDMMTYHNFPVEMRTVPSITQVSAGVTSDFIIIDGGVDLTKAGVGFQGRATAANGSLTGFVAGFDAEL